MELAICILYIGSHTHSRTRTQTALFGLRLLHWASEFASETILYQVNIATEEKYDGNAFFSHSIHDIADQSNIYANRRARGCIYSPSIHTY